MSAGVTVTRWSLHVARARHTTRALTTVLPSGCFDHRLNDRVLHAELRLAELGEGRGGPA